MATLALNSGLWVQRLLIGRSHRLRGGTPPQRLTIGPIQKNQSTSINGGQTIMIQQKALAHMEGESQQVSAGKQKATTCCILFATADWDEPYWTNKQHCAKALAELGVKVLYVESIGLRSPKTNSTKDLKRIISRLNKAAYSYLVGPSQRSRGIYVVSPLALPGIGASAFRSKVNTWLLDFLVTAAARKLGFRDALLWAYHPLIGNCLKMPQVSKSLYHCVDDLSSVPGIDTEAFRLAEAKFLRMVDCCYVTAPNLLKKCLPYNSNTKYLPNVVDIDHFSRDGEQKQEQPSPLRSIPKPRIVYHGILSDFKLDFDLLLECAELRPDWAFVVIGAEREGQQNPLVKKLRSLKNTYFLGYIPYKDMPEYLNNMDVGILPSLINEYTKSMFPMKFYEYIASGIPVVSTPLDFTKSVGGSLLISDNSAGFVDAIRVQLEKGRLSRKESERVIGDNTWRTRTLKMLEPAEENTL
jgi:glycosyltransferase involved in cell wall biosynthesis